MSNTHLPSLKRLRDWFGGTISARSGEPKAGHRRSFTWQTGAAETLALCQEVLPFLHEKFQQAALLIEFAYYKGDAGNPRRDEIIKELKALKRPEWSAGDINKKETS